MPADRPLWGDDVGGVEAAQERLFREVDRLTQQFFGGVDGTVTRPAMMPMDAYRSGDDYVIQFDLPGVSPDSIDLDVERNVLTVKAERKLEYGDADVQVVERPRGVSSRQLFLGDTLNTDNINASYDAGVPDPSTGGPQGDLVARGRAVGRMVSCAGGC